MVRRKKVAGESTSHSKGRGKGTKNRNWLHQREKILSVAGRLFWKKGYLGTSVDDIAHATSLNKSTIFYYFKSKVAILQTIITRSMEELNELAKAVIDADVPAKRKLEDLITNHLKWQTKHIGLAIGQLERRNLPPKLLRDYIAMRDQYEALYRKIITDLAIENEWNIKKQDVKLFSLFILGFLNSMVQWYNKNGELSVEQIASRACTFVFHALESSVARKTD